MAVLRYFPPSGPPEVHPLRKPITTIGRAPGNDIHVPQATVESQHAQIVFSGRDFEIEGLSGSDSILINGKRKRRARLVNGDRLTLGEAQFAFSMMSDFMSSSSERPPGSNSSGELDGLERLFQFTEQLVSSENVDQLLETLLDNVIELTGAARGMVLLVENSGSAIPSLKVRASRNVRREQLPTEGDGISDSIVRQVIETRRAVIVSDAVTDTTFGRSESVIALQLSSVMCAPLLSRGEVTGALYVANNEVKSLFERRQLDILGIFAAQASLLLTNAMLLSALRADKQKLEAELIDKRFGEIIGACPSMLDVFRKLQKVATTDISVLITGETGTGKELIAREIHRRSDRVAGPFVTVNCGAIPENLMESEMFGHVKGAFTGAIASRGGRFQQANGGTLFLDEVGELTPQLQVKLLRALQERVVTRVGDSRPEKADIRVVSATNRNLEEMIADGSFREDLFYRLNVVNLWLPPLRERGDDIFIIAKALLSKYADELGSTVRGFTPTALTAIKRYYWPGNIRQLENRLKKALVLCDKTLLTPEDLDISSDAAEPVLPLERAKEEFQRRYVLQALERNNGNRTQTARDLGVDPRTIFRYLEREQNPPPPGSGT
jgi:transcriptional regulator with GAF, ATPase, and Fis domain